ncbi:malic enzyme, NAD binding domain protein [Orientia chuto str. Dubai]|uniref:Malic enzyme, NAD binding domain protein n=1 Tax=Orientia chuto str. Dubai TaxID=1359168 RepID=A0A0F3MNM1_9RICK|nr:malic enzyme, NAD binding domain protein [Orientia chuto str. Dubai]
MVDNLLKNNSLISKLSLEYHKMDNIPGKIAMVATKPLATQHDLALAYSPGVSAPCIKIFNDINTIYDYTSRGNSVAVISNGTAVLGLGNLGAAAAKPVMEGKAALFKKFADINAMDLEVDTEDPDEIIKLIKYLKYNWGGINLEDIKAPECFIIENKLKELIDIPVFHDDQHGTAVAVIAGIINAADLTGRKNLKNLKVIINGAGAAGIACAALLKSVGIENITLCDSQGVILKAELMA